MKKKNEEIKFKQFNSTTYDSQFNQFNRLIKNLKNENNYLKTTV